MNVPQLGKWAKIGKIAKMATKTAPQGWVPIKHEKCAKSITIKAPESGVSSIQVTALYKGQLVEDESVTITLTQNGQSHTFPEMTEYMGSTMGRIWGQHGGTWASAMPIDKIKVTINGEGKVFEANPKEYCNDVVQNLAFSLHHEPEHIKMI